jgi:osmotically-inducible protein OsmY
LCEPRTRIGCASTQKERLLTMNRKSALIFLAANCLATLAGITVCQAADQGDKHTRATTSPAVVQPMQQSIEQSDQKIAERLRQKLSEAGIDQKNVDLTVDHTVVTFRGRFGNADQASTATQLATSIAGVTSVQNLAEIQPLNRPDDQILADVQKSLRENPATQQIHPKVSVKDGVVTLEGDVRIWQMKDLAAWAAAKVDGVQRVENKIKINLPPPGSLNRRTQDEQVTSAE